MWKNNEFTLTLKIFRQTDLVLLMNLISRNLCEKSRIQYIGTEWKDEKFSLTEKNFKKQLFSNFFNKTINFTKFCEKLWQRISAISTLWSDNWWQDKRIILGLVPKKSKRGKNADAKCCICEIDAKWGGSLHSNQFSYYSSSDR